MTKRPLSIQGYSLLRGKVFSPAEAERVTGIRFTVKNEPGDIGTTGRYRGHPTPYGAAQIDFEDEGMTGDMISPESRILDLLERHITAFRNAGAEEIILHLDVTFRTRQCNLEQSPALLARLAALNIYVTISCNLEESKDFEWEDIGEQGDALEM